MVDVNFIVSEDVIGECGLADELVMRMLPSSWSFYMSRTLPEPVHEQPNKILKQARKLIRLRKACGRASQHMVTSPIAVQRSPQDYAGKENENKLGEE
jgi:hypothetical protein